MNTAKPSIEWLAISRLVVCLFVALSLGFLTFLDGETRLTSAGLAFEMEPWTGMIWQRSAKLQIDIVSTAGEKQTRRLAGYGTHMPPRQLIFLLDDLPNWAAKVIITPKFPSNTLAVSNIRVSAPGGKLETVEANRLSASGLSHPLIGNGEIRGLRGNAEQVAVTIDLGGANFHLAATQQVASLRNVLLPALMVAAAAFFFCLLMFEAARAATTSLSALGASSAWATTKLSHTLPVTLAILFGVVAAMSSGLPLNAHSDEYLHVAAADFWKSRSLPEHVQAPSVRPSLSHYGVSYLSTADFGYFVAGKFARLVDGFLPQTWQAVRLFNLLLFGLILLGSGYLLKGTPAPLMPLMIPQMWYLFSYYNSDAWGLFCAFLLVALCLGRHSLFRRLLDGKLRGSSLWHATALLAFLLTLLVWSKKNYWLLLVFFAILAAHALVRSFLARNHRTAMRHVLPSIATACLVASMAYALAAAYQAAYFPAPDVESVAEQHALKGFRPSDQAADSRFPTLNLKDQGVGLTELLFERKWLLRSAMALFGQFGWTHHHASMPYYWIMLTLFLAALLVLTRCLFTSPPPGAFPLRLAMLLLLPLAFALSAWHSWTGDFQPQGRYVLTIIPILVFLEFDSSRNLFSRNQLLPSIALIALGLGIACLLFVALKLNG